MSRIALVLAVSILGLPACANDDITSGQQRTCNVGADCASGSCLPNGTCAPLADASSTADGAGTSAGDSGETPATDGEATAGSDGTGPTGGDAAASTETPRCPPSVRAVPVAQSRREWHRRSRDPD